MPRIFVVLAGGSGKRLWPSSTHGRPKQFVELFGDKSMLELAYERVKNLAPPEHIFVVTAQEHAERARNLLSVPFENVIEEPYQRDTAAAIALAHQVIWQNLKQPFTMAVVTADHLIEPVSEFERVLTYAMAAAEQDSVVYTLGITPTHASTAYGYLECGSPVKKTHDIDHLHVVAFKEKPDEYKAQNFINSGNYLWNSGMFVFPSHVLWNAFLDHLPEHGNSLAGIGKEWPKTFSEKATATPSEQEQRARLKLVYSKLPKISVDYGILEKLKEIRVIPCQFFWCDIGSWSSIEKYYPEDEKFNRKRGNVTTLMATDNFVFCEDQKETVGLIGVNELLVVRSGDRTLIAHKTCLDDLKKFVDMLPENKKDPSA